jgi:hypothetical protein
VKYRSGIDPEWRRCKRWIEAALPYACGTHTIEDLEREIWSGRLTLIALARSALIVEIIAYPRLRALHIFLAGGDLGELKAFVDGAMPELARLNRCSRITIAGRKGFSRALRDIGFEEKWVVLTKEIQS